MNNSVRGWLAGCALLGGLALLGPVQAAMYKWVDDKGVTQYTQYPPPNRESEVMVPPPTPAQDPDGAQLKLEDQLKQLDENQKARAESEAEAAKTKAAADQRKKNCEAARGNLEKLTTGGRKRVIGPDGVATYLTEEDRQAKIAEAKKHIEESCQKK